MPKNHPLMTHRPDFPDCGRIPVGLLDKRVCYYPCLRLTDKKQAVIKRHGQLPGSWSDAFPARCSGFGLGSVRNESGQPARMGPAAD